MEIDETRKKYILAGVAVGAVTVGLIVLARRVPRDQWGDTLGRIGRDVLGLVKARYGDNEFVRIAERTLDKALLPPRHRRTHRSLTILDFGFWIKRGFTYGYFPADMVAFLPPCRPYSLLIQNPKSKI